MLEGFVIGFLCGVTALLLVLVIGLLAVCRLVDRNPHGSGAAGHEFKEGYED